MKSPTPVILVALAADRFGLSGGHIAVSAEKDAIRAAFELAESQGRVRVVVESDVTVESYGRALLTYGDAIVGFHFAGHATASGLVLGTGAGRPDGMHVRGLAETLAQLPRLKWVFLNGCDTAPQLATLQAACPVPVISTRGAIRDDVAIEFADWFYAALGKGWSLRRAYAYAEGLVRRRAPAEAGDPDALVRMLRPAGRSNPAWPWVFTDAPDQPDAADYALPARSVPGGVDAPAQPAAGPSRGRASPMWWVMAAAAGAAATFAAVHLVDGDPAVPTVATPDAAPDVVAPKVGAVDPTPDAGRDATATAADASLPDAAVRDARVPDAKARSAAPPPRPPLICARDMKRRINRAVARRDCCASPREAVGAIAAQIERDVPGRCTAVLLCAEIDPAARCR